MLPGLRISPLSAVFVPPLFFSIFHPSSVILIARDGLFEGFPAPLGGAGIDPSFRGLTESRGAGAAAASAASATHGKWQPAVRGEQGLAVRAGAGSESRCQGAVRELSGSGSHDLALLEPLPGLSRCRHR